MRMDYRYHRQVQDFRMEVKKMQIWKKLFYAIFICILAYSINSGDPKKNSIARHFQITDQKIEYIFETTIAIETKTIKQRISEQQNGVWKYINGYIFGRNWADIEVKIKTRIGIKLNSITYDRLTNNVHINFGDPCILDRTLKTKIIQTSDNFFKWSIQSYQKHKQQFEELIIERQSKQMIRYFQSNNQKMQQLQNQYYGKIKRALQYDTTQFSIEFNILKLNQLVLFYVGMVIPQFYIGNFKKAYQYEKPIKPYQAIQSQQGSNSKFTNANLSSIDIIKQQAITKQQIQMIAQNKQSQQIVLKEPVKQQIIQSIQTDIQSIKYSKNQQKRNKIRSKTIRQKTKKRLFPIDD